MCRNTKNTMRWAAQRWMFRVSNPNVTWLWISRMFVYACVAEGTEKNIRYTPVTVSTRNRKNDSPPRQNVYANLTACRRTRTGWMCRNTLFMTAYARERSSRGYGWRNSHHHHRHRATGWATLLQHT